MSIRMTFVLYALFSLLIGIIICILLILGEFEKLDIDDKGIYAVRGLNNQEVRTYEMSTGQRSTIAMAVMFALHMAAPDAPQFLLLDEPLATMDDTQVLNVLVRLFNSFPDRRSTKLRNKQF